jgi:TonB family protein
VKLKLVALATVLFVVSLKVHAQDSSTGLPTILSDPYGYDFAPYLNGMMMRIRTNWYALMPEIARNGEKGRVIVGFTIVRSGEVKDLRVFASSRNDALDRAAVAAISSSNPLPALPAGFKGEQLVLQIPFLYNLKSQER